MELVKKLFKAELLLSITFLLIPFLLPLTSGIILESVSAYAHSPNVLLFDTLFVLGGGIMMVDGMRDIDRRYNIILGFVFILIAAFPVMDWRLEHDVFAILFFLGYSYIITYYATSISIITKLIFGAIIVIALLLFLFGFINLFMAEAIGFLALSAFMFIRFLEEY